MAQEARKAAKIVLASSCWQSKTPATIRPSSPSCRLLTRRDPAAAIEIPLPVKAHLGLDDARSWVVVNEGNEFVWPGYDLRRTAKSGDYQFGFLPPRFFNQIREAFVAFHRVGKARMAARG